MYEYINAAFLGMLQGLTEFLPISSSGHLALASFLGMGEESGVFFAVMLHLGTLLSVVVAYRKQLFLYIKKPFCKEVGCLALASVITCSIVLLLKLTVGDALDSLFSSPLAVGLSFVATSAVLLAAEVLGKRKKSIGYISSSVTGVAQSVAAVFSGLSRSGTTIAAQVLCGVEREKAADFSFLLSIPVIAGAGLFELISLSSAPLTQPVNTFAVLCGAAFAFIFGLMSIKLFVGIVKNKTFYPFCIYTFVIGLFTLTFFA